MIEQIQPKEPAPIHAEKKDKKEVHIRKMKLKRGLNLYSYNHKTGDLLEVKIERVMYMEEKSGKMRPVRKDKAQWNPDCMYFQALNLKNAARKVTNMLKQMGFNFKITN